MLTYSVKLDQHISRQTGKEVQIPFNIELSVVYIKEETHVFVNLCQDVTSHSLHHDTKCVIRSFANSTDGSHHSNNVRPDIRQVGLHHLQTPVEADQPIGIYQ